MACCIGLDLGTSAIKGVLLSSGGEVIAVARQATEILRPQTGRVEMDSVRFYGILCRVIRELVPAAKGEPVAALALSGATGNTLLLDDTGAPLRNAIHWMDMRAADEPSCEPPAAIASEVYHVSGWPGFRGFPLAHLSWLKRHEPENYKRASRVGMNITYQFLRLCGAWAMDYSTATTFYLQNQVDRRWHQPYLDWLELKKEQLPELLPSGSVIGRVSEQAASETALSTDAAVVLGAFDHPSAARGVVVTAPGDVLLSCGTSWVGFYPVKDRALALSQKMLIDPFLAPRGPWGAMFSLPRVGEEVQAFVDRTFEGEASPAARYALFNAAAAASAKGSGEPCRALMERISENMATRMRELAQAGLLAGRIFMVGGPSESPVWPDILREATGLDIAIPKNGAYAGALGAAFMAAAGIRGK